MNYTIWVKQKIISIPMDGNTVCYINNTEIDKLIRANLGSHIKEVKIIGNKITLITDLDGQRLRESLSQLTQYHSPTKR